MPLSNTLIEALLSAQSDIDGSSYGVRGTDQRRFIASTRNSRRLVNEIHIRFRVTNRSQLSCMNAFFFIFGTPDVGCRDCKRSSHRVLKEFQFVLSQCTVVEGSKTVEEDCSFKQWIFCSSLIRSAHEESGDDASSTTRAQNEAERTFIGNKLLQVNQSLCKTFRSFQIKV
jgi:hypothetical protein